MHGSTGLLREPRVLFALEQHQNRYIFERPHRGHLTRESEPAGVSRRLIDDDHGGTEAPVGHDLARLGRIRGQGYLEMGRKPKANVLDDRLIGGDDEDGHGFDICHFGLDGRRVCVVRSDLLADSPQKTFDIEIESGLHRLEAAESRDESSSRPFSLRHRVDENRRVVPGETSSAEGAPPGSIGIGADLRQKEGPVAGIALRFDLQGVASRS